MIYRRIQSLSQQPVPATPACGDKYPYWLLAAFGNLFMANFYCTPKEIRALCILGKKNTPFKYSFFRGCVCVCCVNVTWWQGTEWLSVEPPFLSRAADSVSVWGIPASGPSPQVLLENGQGGHGTHPLFLAWIRICALETLPQSPERKRERSFHSVPDWGN